MPLFDARYDSLSSTDTWAAQHPDHGIDELLAGFWPKNGNFTNHQLPAGSEQLAGAGVAVGTERARPEAGRRQMHGARVAVRIARNLAEDPVAPASVGQGDGRTQLRLRQIREWERNEDYPAG